MKKNIVQDVVPPKKSIRNVELSSRSKSIDGTSKAETISSPKKDLFSRPVSINKQAPLKADYTEEVKHTPPQPPVDAPYRFEYSEPEKSSRKWVYLSLFVLVVAIGFGVSAMFRSAVIKVAPRQETMVVNATFAVKKDATGSILGFQTETITKEVEKTIDGTNLTTEQTVTKKAQGRIVIYNSYSPESQKLVATTRFETPEGLIFRLVSPVTVPGTQTKDGKVVSGSVEVTVEADKAGADYNVGMKDFTIPGFKGDPKYSKVYARSKTEMTGGFSGKQKIIPKDMLDKADAEMEASLKESLSKDIEVQIPTDFVMYKNSISYKFDAPTQSNSGTGSVVLKKRATASAIIFDKGSLTRAVLSKIMPNLGDDMVKITNLDALDFQPELPVSSLNTATVMNFTLNGNAQLVWVFDENNLKTDLLGLSTTNAYRVISNNKAIKEAWITAKPFWNRNIPSDPEKVELINTLNAQ